MNIKNVKHANTNFMLNKTSDIQNNKYDLFKIILKILKTQVSIFIWQGFFISLIPLKLHNNTFTLCAKSKFQQEWINKHYINQIKKAAEKVTKTIIYINIVYNDKNNNNIYKNTNQIINPILSLKTNIKKCKLKISNNYNIVEKKTNNKYYYHNNFNLNYKYTFDSFIEGPSNKTCVSSCHSVAKDPGTELSPLFLFGSVGLGKTHLLNAIGIAAQANHPTLKISYISAEQWVNSYITSIRKKEFDIFRKKFRTNCDIFLIDDIQFLSGKKASQDEFFHTFNALHNANKQIVVTSDKYPCEITGFQERLKTRLYWGLLANISPPELSTRIKILEMKSQYLNVKFSYDVLHFIATNFNNSIRELEGALIRLIAYKNTIKTNINIAKAKLFLKPILKSQINKKLSLNYICREISHYYNLELKDIKGKCKRKEINMARQIAMSLCKNFLNLSLNQIGVYFDNRNHSTIHSNIKVINNIRKNNISIDLIFKYFERKFIHS